MVHIIKKTLDPDYIKNIGMKSLQCMLSVQDVENPQERAKCLGISKVQVVLRKVLLF